MRAAPLLAVLLSSVALAQSEPAVPPPAPVEAPAVAPAPGAPAAEPQPKRRKLRVVDAGDEEQKTSLEEKAASGDTAAATALADTRPVRGKRKILVGAELAWNGLGGLGLTAAYHLLPQATVELAAGFGVAGWKGGVRARYNLLTGEATPFVGVGFIHAFGLGSTLPIPSGSGNASDVIVRDVSYVQAVGGLDYTSSGGFTFLATLGYAFRLNDPVEVVGPALDNGQRQTVGLLYGSGLVVGIALGYSF